MTTGAFTKKSGAAFARFSASSRAGAGRFWNFRRERRLNISRRSKRLRRQTPKLRNPRRRRRPALTLRPNAGSLQRGRTSAIISAREKRLERRFQAEGALQESRFLPKASLKTPCVNRLRVKPAPRTPGASRLRLKALLPTGAVKRRRPKA